MPPSLFPLNSEQLSNLSAALKSSAAHLVHNATEAAERWQYIYGLGLAGESFNAAYEQEDMTHRASRQTAAQLAELARTMDKAAAKQKVLDGLAQYALPFLEAEGEINIPVSIFMTQLGTLARASPPRPPPRWRSSPRIANRATHRCTCWRWNRERWWWRLETLIPPIPSPPWSPGWGPAILRAGRRTCTEPT